MTECYRLRVNVVCLEVEAQGVLILCDLHLKHPDVVICFSKYIIFVIIFIFDYICHCIFSACFFFKISRTLLPSSVRD